MAAGLTLEQQVALLRRWFPKAAPWSKTIAGAAVLHFRLRLRPTPTSETYTVLFVYALGIRPLVYVEDPEPVTEAHGQPTPHLNGDGTLCLYDPTKREWTAADPLVYTTVQWTVRWLYHYEHWLTFGEWRGDHDEPEIPAPHLSDAGTEEAA